MGSSRLGRSHRGLGIFISLHMLLNINLVGYSSKLTDLAFFSGIEWKALFQAQLKDQNTKHIFWQPEFAYRYKFGCSMMISFLKNQKNHVCNRIIPKVKKATIIYICSQRTKRIAFTLAILPSLPQKK